MSNTTVSLKSSFLDALKGQNNSKPPIWIMRQAGRYLPSYRALRKQYSFQEMCHNPELVAKITQLPIQTFGMDAAILFSDILLIIEALGLKARFEEGAGPIIDMPIRSAADVDRLPIKNVREVLSCVGEGIQLLKPQLSVPLIGFCGAPFTVASYMIEGKSSRDLKLTKQWMFGDSASFHRLLNKLTQLSIEYLKMQIAAGVDAIQIFDTWANMLSPASFREVCFPYLKKIVDELKPTKVPIILFCKDTRGFLSQLAEISPQGISLDWNTDIAEVRLALPTMTLQGNLDPYVLYASKEVIRREAFRILESMREDPAFIFNLGHGILPDVPPDAVKTLVECVKL